MPAATTKADLLAVTENEYAKLRGLVDPLPRTVALTKVEEGTSIKDIIGHRAHWIDLFLGWQADGAAGRAVAFPAPGYKWNELKRYNADLRDAQAGLGWDAARDMLADRHAKLVARIEGLREDALYGGPMPGAKNTWTTGRWAEAAGASHYRSATKMIRKWAKALTA